MLKGVKSCTANKKQTIYRWDAFLSMPVRLVARGKSTGSQENDLYMVGFPDLCERLQEGICFAVYLNSTPPLAESSKIGWSLKPIIDRLKLKGCLASKWACDGSIGSIKGYQKI